VVASGSNWLMAGERRCVRAGARVEHEACMLCGMRMRAREPALIGNALIPWWCPLNTRQRIPVVEGH
jgi:hypothetical protein